MSNSIIDDPAPGSLKRKALMAGGLKYSVNLYLGPLMPDSTGRVLKISPWCKSIDEAMTYAKEHLTERFPPVATRGREACLTIVQMTS